MAIRRQVQRDSHTQTMTDFVDLGDGTDETNVASEALVFMVVGLRGHWKTAIAYFSIQTFTLNTQKALLLHALEKLHEQGVKVLCVTMDGQLSNISMCRLF